VKGNRHFGDADLVIAGGNNGGPFSVHGILSDKLLRAEVQGLTQMYQDDVSTT